MASFMRKYNKRILAVLGVFLMVSFLIGSFLPGGSRRGANPVQARVGDTELRLGDFQRAAAEWEVLTRQIIINVPLVTPGGRRTFGVPVATWELAARGQALDADALGRIIQLTGQVPPSLEMAAQVVSQITPEAYLLLLTEAKRMGVTVSEDRYREVMSKLPPAPNADRRELWRQAVYNYLLVLEVFNRVADTVKVSQPMRVHEIAARFQQISVKLVEFPVDRFLDRVEAPTTQQVEEHFRLYADKTPDPDAPTLTFGYLVPNRVKLQFIAIPRSAVRQQITVKDTDVYRFYRDNPRLFSATAPATQPAAGPATQWAATAPAIAPTTRPFEQVADEIRNRLIDEETNRRMADIERLVSSTLRNDYTAWKAELAKQAPTTGPTTAPSSLGEPYDTYEYLQKLSALVQQKHNVLPTAANLSSFMSARDLQQAIVGLGDAFGRTRDGFVRFHDYATNWVRPLMTEQQQRRAQQLGIETLSLWEPGIPMTDNSGNLYLFRITEVSPAHPPASLADVRPRVEKDLRLKAAYEKAMAAANALVESVRGRDLEAAAAETPGLQVITTGRFSSRQDAQVTGYELDPKSRLAFLNGAFGLLRTRMKTGEQHPVGVVELPAPRRVLVMQLHELEPARKGELFDQETAYIGVELQARIVQELMRQWFEVRQIFSRMNYQPRGSHG